MKKYILFLVLLLTSNVAVADGLLKATAKDCLVSVSETQMFNVKYLESIEHSIFDKTTTYINLTTGNKLVIPNKNPKEVLTTIMNLIKKECQ